MQKKKSKKDEKNGNCQHLNKIHILGSANENINKIKVSKCHYSGHFYN